MIINAVKFMTKILFISNSIHCNLSAHDFAKNKFAKFNGSLLTLLTLIQITQKYGN